MIESFGSSNDNKYSNQETEVSTNSPKFSNVENWDSKEDLDVNREKKEAIKRTYEKLNFGLDVSSIPEKWASIIKKLKEKYRDDNSLEWSLLNNPQIQSLLASIVSWYASEWASDTAKHSKKEATKEDSTDKKSNNWEEENNWEEKKQSVESREAYALRESTYEKFEDWLLSKDWIRTLMNEIDNHIDEKWNLIENYPIDKKDLGLKLGKARITNLHSNYNLTNGIFDDSEKKKLKDLWTVIQDGVNNAVKNYLVTWWDTFNDEMVKNLKSAIFEWENGNILKWLKGWTKEKDEFQILLRDYIKKYSNLVLEKKGDEVVDVNLNTGSKQLDLQLRSYLFIYGKTFIPEIFSNQWWYEANLLETLKIILSEDYQSLEKKIKNKWLLNKEKQAEKLRRERDNRRRQEAAQRIREWNERTISNIPSLDKEHTNIEGIQTKSINVNTATWAEIAADANLWNELSDYELDIKEPDLKEQWTKEIAFNEAWKNFIQSHDDVKSTITMRQMRNLFDINNNTFNISKWENFIKYNRLLKDMAPGEVEEIRNALISFSSIFNDTISKLSNNSSELKTKMWETVKTYAIGAVIDNVKDVFSMASNEWNQNEKSWKFKWFELNTDKPVIKHWNNIIISGLFNGSDVKVRYNLKTGELFMNSLIHKDEVNPNKISIWDKSSIENPDSIDYPIWTIKPFNDILNDYSKLPPKLPENNINNLPSPEKRIWQSWFNRWNWNRPIQNITKVPSQPNIPKKEEIKAREEKTKNDMLNSQMDLISEAVKQNSEAQVHKNSVITKFFKTFNIWWFNSLDFNKWSNLFDMIQIFDNSDSSSLEIFNDIFMPEIMEHSWLKWWDNNAYQDKKNKKSEKIFDYDGSDENIIWLRDSFNNFKPSQFSWVANFEASHQLWFVKLIKEKLLDDSNSKLDKTKMNNFKKYIIDFDPEKELDKKLDKDLNEV